MFPAAFLLFIISFTEFIPFTYLDYLHKVPERRPAYSVHKKVGMQQTCLKATLSMAANFTLPLNQTKRLKLSTRNMKLYILHSQLDRQGSESSMLKGSTDHLLLIPPTPLFTHKYVHRA